MTESLAGVLPYEKWDATGNDFVIIDLARSPLSETEFSASLVSKICHRQHGVGADGVVLLHTADGDGVPSRVVIWNSDGSLGSMCGNALRCVALILARQRTAEFAVQIGERLVTTRAEGKDRSSVLMGPASAVADRPSFDSLPELDQVLGGQGYLVSFGNPHYVVPYTEVPKDWAARGALAQPLAHSLLGTGGINCGFLQRRPGADGNYLLRVFERGVGVTQSCGSGACAASAVLETQLEEAPPHRLALLGGVLQIGRSGDGSFELTGPAHYQFEGQWSLS